jgi:hypothetical protein
LGVGMVVYIHIFLKLNETLKWQEKLLGNKWLDITEGIAYKKIITYNKIIELSNLGKFLYKVKGKWQNEVTKTM